VSHSQDDDLVSRCGVDPLALEQDLSAGGPDEPGDRSQRRGLAGAVGADQGDDLTLVDREADLLDREDLAVGDLEVLDLEHGRHGVSPASSSSVPVPM